MDGPKKMVKGPGRFFGKRKTERQLEKDEGTLFRQLRPCIWVLMALGMWPIFEKRGRVVFRMCSFPFVYAVLVWIITATITIRGLLYWIEVVKSAEYFSLKAYYSFFIVVGHCSLVIPLLYWPSLAKITEAFAYAHRLQANYRRVRGVPLRLGLGWRSVAVAIMSPTVGVSFTYWSHDAGYTPWNQIPTYEMNGTFLTIVPQTWELLTVSLERASDQLRRQINEVLLSGAGPPVSTSHAAWAEHRLGASTLFGRGGTWDNVRASSSAEGRGVVERAAGNVTNVVIRKGVRELRDLRGLYLQLQHLLGLWGTAWSLPLAHLLIFSMSTMLLSVFGIAIPLLRGQVLDDRLAGMMVAVFHHAHILHTVCTTGYRLRLQVKDAFIKELLRAKFPTRETDMYKEVLKFLGVIELQDPHVTLRGFTTLNRALGIGCFSILVTYMVVLMQFAYAKGAK